MIKYCEEYSSGAVKIGDNLIELKMIGAIFVEVYTDSIIMELQLKNGKYKKLEVSDEVHKFISEAWLGELDRRNREAIRCSILKDKVSLSEVLKEHISTLFVELKQELKGENK